MVVLNKADITESEDLDNLQDEFQKKGFKVATISGLTGQGIDEIKETIADILEDLISNEVVQAKEDDPVDES